MKPTFFTDRDLGKSVPAALRAAGISVEAHAQHFAHDTPDEEWIAAIAAQGWVAVTHDGRIRYKPNEKQAVLDAGLALIVLVGKARHAELSENFVRSISRIEAFLEREAPPLIAKLYRPTPSELERNPEAPGRIERWM